MISVKREKAIANSGNERTRDECVFVFFRVTEKSPQSIRRSGSAAGSRGRREERSMSAPDRICARMLWDTGGGSMTTALDGTGIGVAVKRE